MPSGAEINVRDIQRELLNIYEQIRRICDKHQIHCFAIGGTMLGAVRHNGFIPWDDDMDLGIPIDEFERFRSACKKELPEPLEFKDLLWIGGKIHDKTTTFIETPCAMHRENGYGIFIDIFPLIGTPNDEEERFNFLNNMLLYSFQAMLFDRYPKASTYSKKQIEEWRDSILKHNKLDESDYAAEFSFGYRYLNNTIGLRDPIEMRFEKTTILVPSTYDKDLTSHYGDYMKLPPRNKRHMHSDYAYVDFNKPYTEYYEKLNRLDPKILSFLRQKHKLEGDFFMNSALFMADGDGLRRELGVARKELDSLHKSTAYRVLRKLRIL